MDNEIYWVIVRLHPREIRIESHPTEQGAWESERWWRKNYPHARVFRETRKHYKLGGEIPRREDYLEEESHD